MMPKGWSLKDGSRRGRGHTTPWVQSGNSVRLDHKRREPSFNDRSIRWRVTWWRIKHLPWSRIAGLAVVFGSMMLTTWLLLTLADGGLR